MSSALKKIQRLAGRSQVRNLLPANLPAGVLDLIAPNINPIRWAWSGACTQDSFDVVAIFSAPAATTILAVGTTPDILSSVVAVVSGDATQQLEASGPAYTIFGTIDHGSATLHRVKFTATGLQPDTVYYCGLIADQSMATHTIKTRTFPVAGSAKSFSIILGACSNQEKVSDGIYQAIAAEDTYLFVHMGDLHYYGNQGTDGPEQPRRGIDYSLHEKGMKAALKNMPMAYVYDDHDFGGIDSPTIDSEPNFADMGQTTIQAYGELVPHWPFKQPANDGSWIRGITQSYTIGRVRFIQPDMRAFRYRRQGANYNDNADTIAGTAAGDGRTVQGFKTWDQIAWIKAELLQAKADGMLLAVFINSATTDHQSPSAGSWSEVAPVELRSLSQWMIANDTPETLMVQGDKHELHYFDGVKSGTSWVAGETLLDVTANLGIIPHINSATLHPADSQNTPPGTPAEWAGMPKAAIATPGDPRNYVRLDFTDNGDRVDYQATARTWQGTEHAIGSASSTDRNSSVTIPSRPRWLSESDGPTFIKIPRNWFASARFHIKTFDGTALAGVDYVAADIDVDVKPNDRYLRVPITLINRAGAQGVRRFEIEVTAISRASVTNPLQRLVVDIYDAEDVLIKPFQTGSVAGSWNMLEEAGQVPNANQAWLYDESGRLRHVSQEVANQQESYLTSPSRTLADIRARFTFYGQDDDGIGCGFRTMFNTAMYTLNFHMTTGNWVLALRNAASDNGSTTIASGNVPTVSRREYEIELSMLGPDYEIYLDGDLLHAWSDTLSAQTGTFDFLVDSTFDCYFDDLVIVNHESAGARKRQNNIFYDSFQPAGGGWAPAVPGAQWTQIDESVPPSAAWNFGSRSANQPVANQPGADDRGALLIPTNPAVIPPGTWTDYDLRLTVQAANNVATGNAGCFAGVVIRYQDADNYYRIRHGTVTAPDVRLILEKFVGGVLTQLASVPLSRVATDVKYWHIRAQGDSIIVEVDEVELINVNDASHAFGKIGLYCVNCFTANFRHVSLYAI